MRGHRVQRWFLRSSRPCRTRGYDAIETVAAQPWGVGATMSAGRIPIDHATVRRRHQTGSLNSITPLLSSTTAPTTLIRRHSQPRLAVTGTQAGRRSSRSSGMAGTRRRRRTLCPRTQLRREPGLLKESTITRTTPARGDPLPRSPRPRSKCRFSCLAWHDDRPVGTFRRALQVHNGRRTCNVR